MTPELKPPSGFSLGNPTSVTLKPQPQASNPRVCPRVFNNLSWFTPAFLLIGTTLQFLNEYSTPTTTTNFTTHTSVCCFVLLTRYWEIVTVPGSFLNQGTWGGRILTLQLKGGPEPSNFEDLCLVNVSVKWFSKLRFGTSKIQLNWNIWKPSLKSSPLDFSGQRLGNTSLVVFLRFHSFSLVVNWPELHRYIVQIFDEFSTSSELNG